MEMFSADEIVPDANLDSPGSTAGGKRNRIDCRSLVILIWFSAISASYATSGFVTAILIQLCHHQLCNCRHSIPKLCWMYFFSTTLNSVCHRCFLTCVGCNVFPLSIVDLDSFSWHVSCVLDFGFIGPISFSCLLDSSKVVTIFLIPLYYGSL